MLSLRSFHLLFILIAILGADLFAVWSVWYFVHNKDASILAFGIVAAMGGLGLIWYALRLVRSLDAADIH